MSHVFISFHHHSIDFVETLTKKLVEEVGLECWVYKDKLRAGDYWRREIDKAIKNCSALIVVMTPDAKASEYVTYEWAFALGLDKPVLPILLERTELHPRLVEIQYRDFTTQIRPWDLFLQDVHKTLNLYQIAELTQPPPPIIQNTVALLDSPNPKQRDRALEELSKISHPTMPDVLAALTNHPAVDVRVKTADQLFQRLEPRALAGLLEAVELESSIIDREKAIKFIGQIGDPRALQVLVRFQLQAHRWGNHKLDSIIIEAIQSIGRIGIPVLKDLLENQTIDKAVAANVAGWLHDFGEDVFLIDTLEKWLMDEEKQELISGTFLSSFRDLDIHDDRFPNLITALISRIDEFDGSTVSTAIRLAGIHQVVSTLDYVRIALNNHQDSDVRSAAATTLGELGDDSAVDDLMKGMEGDADPNVRLGAATALGIIGDGLALKSLVKALEDTDLKVVKAASRSIVQIGKSGNRPDFLELAARLSSPQLVTRTASAALLGILEYFEAEENLIKLLNDPNPNVCAVAIWALGRLKSAMAVPSLIELLKSNASADSIVIVDGLQNIKIHTETYYNKYSKPPNEDDKISEITRHALRGIATPEALDAINEKAS